MSPDFRQEMEGYAEIRREIEILRKYPFDYASYKGRVGELLNLLHPRDSGSRSPKSGRRRRHPGLSAWSPRTATSLPFRPDNTSTFLSRWEG